MRHVTYERVTLKGSRPPAMGHVTFKWDAEPLSTSTISCALQCVALRFSVLQCFTVCCIVLQCVALCCSVLQCVISATSRTNEMLHLGPQTQHSVCCSALQCVAVQFSVLQCDTMCCNLLYDPCHIQTRCMSHTNKISLFGPQAQHRVYCSVLRCVAVCCSVLQCVAVCHMSYVTYKYNITPWTTSATLWCDC